MAYTALPMVMPMRAIVIYGSKHGNTEKVAMAVAAGMADAGVGAECRSIAASSEEDLLGMDLWVFGSVTRWGGAPLVMRTLLRNGLKEDGARKKRAAVFDTRYHGMGKGAAESMSSILSKAGVQVVASDHFTVKGIKGPLLEGEEERARAFGAAVARAVL
jgi:flavodoxin